jgi:uncharacterized protein YdbL (DUF1318 family)
MMRTRHRMGIASLLVLALLAVPSGGVLADPVDDAKRAGSIGERPDGYLGVVGEDAGSEVSALVDEINERRRQEYLEIARKNGISVEAVSVLAGAKLVERTPPGQYVMTSLGRWIRKPAP